MLDHDLHDRILVPDVRQERELSRAFDCDRNLALVAPAGSADAAVADLALLRHVAAELVDVLVVDLVDLRLAEEAGLAAAGAGRSGALAPSARAAIAIGIVLRCCQESLLRTECRRRRPGSRRR